ncbi:MAG TPA: hypothetical protein VK654_17545 [Nitrospirota bacterium]|nr:hypothetical protein [Nitrospirota bacterium]
MATTTQETYHEETRERYGKSGSLAEGIAGGAGVALAILGLANIMPHYMIPVSTIALSIAFVFEGGAVAGRFTKLLTESTRGRYDVSGLGSGMTAEVIGGIAGIILGILTLLNISPAVLMPAAAVTFGGMLIFSSGISARIDELIIGRMTEDDVFKDVAREAISAAAGVQMLFGITAVTLGILSLVGIAPMLLNLVALLGVGLANLLSGSAISSRMLGILMPHERTT